MSCSHKTLNKNTACQKESMVTEAEKWLPPGEQSGELTGKGHPSGVMKMFCVLYGGQGLHGCIQLSKLIDLNASELCVYVNYTSKSF